MAGQEDVATTRFREYLRINTMQPNPDYVSCTKFLKGQAEEIGLQFRTWEGVAGKTVVIITWEGTDPSLPSILLNSHTDVVPVFEDHWTYPPFSAHKDAKGDIYARGSQDMKCVGMQFLEAVRRLKALDFRFPRTVHMSFVPDEEIGGHEGMEIFVKDPMFKELHIGFALDEGLASPGEEFRVFYGERVAWWVEVKVKGQPGHGSQFIKDTAMEKALKVAQKLQEFRKQQEDILEGDATKELGDVTTVNLNWFKSGVQYNVVPAEVELGFDIRVTPKMDLPEFKKQLDAWTADEGVSYRFLQNGMKNPLTELNEDNKWWVAFREGCKECDIKIKTEIFPAATDSRYLRLLGLPALGFSPMNHTPVLLHDHNEYLNEEVYLKGIGYYEIILKKIFSVQ